jgi:ABC-type branched-subunit amino acid transport system ATPase component
MTDQKGAGNMQSQDLIQVEGMRKRYGPVTDVDGVSFQVHAGEIFGMVGPNGSGKTTIIECMEGLRQPDEVTLRVLGFDPLRQAITLREWTGVQLQSSSLPMIHIFAKPGVSDRTAVVTIAMQRGILSLEK